MDWILVGVGAFLLFRAVEVGTRGAVRCVFDDFNEEDIGYRGKKRNVKSKTRSDFEGGSFLAPSSVGSRVIIDSPNHQYTFRVNEEGQMVWNDEKSGDNIGIGPDQRRGDYRVRLTELGTLEISGRPFFTAMGQTRESVVTLVPYDIRSQKWMLEHQGPAWQMKVGDAGSVFVYDSASAAPVPYFFVRALPGGGFQFYDSTQ